MSAAAPLHVALAERSYPIHFDGVVEILRADVSALRSAGRAVRVLADIDLVKAQPDFLEAAGFNEAEIRVFPSGEPTKALAFFSEALSFLAGGAAGRDCALFAFGGGVIGDLAGYVAASYLRGIDFYQIPSTLLAMVDSSVGGKTGINLPEGKNLVGAFWQPKAVYIDTALLQSLPPREFAAGMAEVVKYGMLADVDLFHELERNPALTPEASALSAVIRRCCAIKAAIVADDEKETAASGGRALLNLGHTFAHAIENVAGYGEYLHGEAVAIGLHLATRLSVELGHLASDSTGRVVDLIQNYALPVRLKAPLPLEPLMQAMQRDKKNRGGQLRFVTMEAIGQATTRNDVTPDVIHALWTEIGAVSY